MQYPCQYPINIGDDNMYDLQKELDLCFFKYYNKILQIKDKIKSLNYKILELKKEYELERTNILYDFNTHISKNKN